MAVGISAAVMAVLVMTVRAAGYATPVTFSAFFTDPAGRLCAPDCLFGIVPGHTTLEDGIRLLETHPITRAMVLLRPEQGYSVNFANREMLVVLRGSPQQPIRDIFLYFVPTDPDLPSATHHWPRLGDAFLLLRSPTTVAVGKDPMRPQDRNRDFVSWYYAPVPLLITARLLDQRMNASTPIKHMQLTTPGYQLGEFNPAHYSVRFLITFTSKTWLGFGHDSRYIAAAIRQRGVTQRLN
jgi:hypothetical protein